MSSLHGVAITTASERIWLVTVENAFQHYFFHLLRRRSFRLSFYNLWHRSTPIHFFLIQVIKYVCSTQLTARMWKVKWAAGGDRQLCILVHTGPLLGPHSHNVTPNATWLTLKKFPNFVDLPQLLKGTVAWDFWAYFLVCMYVSRPEREPLLVFKF
jgi:hypothetical protein